MEIIYVAMVDSFKSGVEKKIIGQYEAMKKYANASLYLLMNRQPESSFLNEINEKKGKIIVPTVNTTNKVKRRINKLRLLEERIKNEHPNSQSIIYLRYPLADRYSYELCLGLKEYQIITEHQTLENQFLKFKKVQWRYLPEVFWGKRVRRLVDGFVGVTREILEYEKKKKASKDFKGIVIGNGISTKNIKARNYEVENESIIKLLFIGTPYPPHGLDRLIKSIDFYLKNYPESKPVILSIVGYSKYLEECKKLVELLKLERYVHFFGFRSSVELEKLYNVNDIAIGSLALHRKNAQETSELKAREYCTKGIPFICSSPDNDFPSNFSYRLQVPEGEALIDMNEIIKFALRCRTLKDHPLEMNNFARNNLDWSVKIKALVEFLEERILKATSVLPK